MAKNAQPERAVARTCIAWMRQMLPVGSIVGAIPNEQRGTGKTELQRARYGMARKRSGVLTGMPDAVAALPDGRTIWIEFKAPGGLVSLAQDTLHTRLRSMGHTVILADSIETCRGGLLAAGVVLRETAGQAVAVAVAVAKMRVAKPKARLPADRVPW